MNIKDILYTAVAGDQHDLPFEISKTDLDQADIIQVSADVLHLILGHRSYLVHLISADYGNKIFVLRINEKDITIKLRDEVESRVHAMGFDVSRNHVKLKQITSPMPGLVLKILVQEGEEVHEGQPVIVLEAMKMENVLSAPTKGTVGKIHVTEKKNVDKGQMLVELV